MQGLDFQVKLDDQQSKAKPQSEQPGQQPAQPQGNALSSMLKKSSHPTAIIFHFAFKFAALAVYLLFSLFGMNATLQFILVILLAAFDFWTVQNITGRLLVGLRWRNVIKEDGTEEWVFESFDEEIQSNKVDLYGFWAGTLGAPLVWALFLFVNVLSFDLFDSMLLLVCVILSVVNLYGYYKCRKDHKQKITGLLKQGAFAAAVGGLV